MDVIEVQYSKLVEAVGNAKNLKEAEAAHEAFVAACIVHNFLDVNMFATVLQKMLFICKSFCASLQVGMRIKRTPLTVADETEACMNGPATALIWQ